MNIKYNHIVLIVLLALSSAFSVCAQDAKKKTKVSLEYFKEQNVSESIIATLKIREDRYSAYEGAEISFYNMTDTSRVLLDKIKTDDEGKARYLLNDPQKIHTDSTGLMVFEAEYNGSATTLGDDDGIEVRRVNLKTSFLQEDSIKYIAIEASEIEPDNTVTPVAALEIFIYIKGTFSLLNIGEEETDKEGRVLVKFPVDMPGDTAGVLTIVSKIQENDLYGTVESKGVINWGRPVPLAAEKQRGLGDTDAPLWMVYTLIILLSIVWFHYFYVVWLIVKIKLAKNRI